MAAADAGCDVVAHPISARGPHDLALTIDVTQPGADSPERALVVLAGVHGVEGFAASPIMCESLARWSSLPLLDDVVVLFVHAVNPWGMAWWRRQNESNVDLNRNWARDEHLPAPNPAYALMHPLLCPDGGVPPSDESLLVRTRELVREHGYAWVKAAVTQGQHSHPDGLYFAGDRTEESNSIIGDVIGDRLSGASEILAVDLHTGHGESAPPHSWLNPRSDRTTTDGPETDSRGNGSRTRRGRTPAHQGIAARSRPDSPDGCPERRGERSRSSLARATTPR